jgi:glycosyltransferase involved in cell wall biosynthesis
MPPLRGISEAYSHWVPQVDLIQSEDSSWDGMLVASAAAAKAAGKPLVVRPLMHLGDAWVQAHYQMAHQLEAYRNAAAILALSKREANALIALGVSSERVHHIVMGIDPLSGLDPQALDAPGFRREFGIRGPVVAFLGANTYDKGAFTLAEAVIALNLEGQPVDLVCAGPQSLSLEAFLRRQGADARAVSLRRFHILGVVDELVKHRLLATCDLLALPSQVDTFGIVLLEAWLHGKPVIGADAGGIPDLIQHERSGLLVPFGNPRALADAIRRLLSQPLWAEQLGAFGRQQTLEHYTWDRTYQTLLGVYDAVLASQR